MIVEFVVAVYWSILQVTVLAAVGLTVAAAIMGRRPALARSVCCAAVGVVVATTLAAPLPAHRISQLLPGGWLESPAVPRSAPTGQAATSANRMSQLVTLELDWAIQSLRAVGKPEEVARESRKLPLRPLAAGFVLACSLGLVRLIVAFKYVARTRRQSDPLTSPRVEQLVTELATKMDVRMHLEVRENQELTSAAVAGCWRPFLVLPGGWRHWRDDELQAVLAHEIAHIARHDAAWRIVAACSATAHILNPLMHCLVDRLVLCQELAADQLAAHTVGRQQYLRAISRLAIDRDNARTHSSALLPIFSAHLIRRVNMLRSMEGTGRSAEPHSRWAPVASATFLTLVAMSMIAARGVAQAPASKPTEVGGERAAASGTFQRATIEPQEVAANEDGMVVLRVGELARRPEVKPFVPMMNAAVSEWIKQLLHLQEAPGVDIGAVDWVGGIAELQIDAPEDLPPGSDHRLAIGGKCAVIKLTNPGELERWFSANLGEIVTHTLEGRQVFQIPPIPAWGPDPIYFCVTEQSTLMVGAYSETVTADTKLSQVFRRSEQQAVAPEWGSVWEKIEGGLGSVIFTDEKIQDLGDPPAAGDEFKKQGERLARQILRRCHAFALGFDVTANSTLELRVRLSHTSAGLADESAESLRALLPTVRDRTSQAADDNPANALVDAIAQSLDVSVAPSEGSETADLVLRAQLPFEELTRLCAAASLGEGTLTSIRE